MNLIRFALALAATYSATSVAFGQIELSYTLRKSIVGATNAELLPGGRILIDDDSKISGSTVAEIRASSLTPYKFAARKTLNEFAELIPLPDVVDAVSKQVTKRFLLLGSGSFKFEATSRTDDLDRSLDIVIGPKPDPVPPDPKPPTPDPPTPVPVTSFRVIFVKESGSTLNAEQTAITGSKAVREYLTAKTTPEGGLAGWREYDPQQNITNERSQIKALWAATKSSITNVPCMVVEVNGVAKVISYPKNVADAIKILKEYGGN